MWNNFENRCCITRDEEKMLAVKKLMLESQLLENIIDKVATVPTVRNRKIDKSAPMEIGLSAQGDEGNSESWISRCKLSNKEQAKDT